jgi:hypothetical protein
MKLATGDNRGKRNSVSPHSRGSPWSKISLDSAPDRPLRQAAYIAAAALFALVQRTGPRNTRIEINWSGDNHPHW